MDLDSAQKETRNASSELFRVKSAYEEAVLQLDEVRRENKNLSNEIKDIMDQISEGGRSIHEIDKICKRLEAEKMELEAALSCCGWRLSRLEVHYMTSGVDVSLIDRLCPNLSNLSISNSRIFQSNKTGTFLPKLVQCRLMRVSYEERRENIFLSECDNLTILHQEAGPAINDQFIQSLLAGPRPSLQALGRLFICLI